MKGNYRDKGELQVRRGIHSANGITGAKGNYRCIGESQEQKGITGVEGDHRDKG